MRWYTRARKFPRLVNRLPGGHTILGGPYTVGQVLAAAAVVVLLWQTAWLWAHFGFIGNLAVLGWSVAGTVLAVGRIPPGTRSPLPMLEGWLRVLARPQGQWLVDNRPVRVPRPSRAGTEPCQRPAGKAVAGRVAARLAAWRLYLARPGSAQRCRGNAVAGSSGLSPLQQKFLGDADHVGAPAPQ